MTTVGLEQTICRLPRLENNALLLQASCLRNVPSVKTYAAVRVRVVILGVFYFAPEILKYTTARLRIFFAPTKDNDD